MKKKLIPSLCLVLALIFSVFIFPAEAGTIKEDPVAQIGETQYYSLADAVQAANAGDTVKLVANVNGSVTVPSGKSMTLDLNGKTLSVSGDNVITNYGTLTITDTNGTPGTIGVTGTSDATAVLNYGILTVEKVTISCVAVGGNSYCINNSGSSCTIKSGTYNSTAIAESSYACGLFNKGTVNVEDGTFTVTSANGDACGLKNDVTGTQANIGGGTFTVTGNYAYGVDIPYGSATVTGGEFNVTGSTAARGLWNETNGTATVTGGTFKVSGPTAYGIYQSGTMTVGGKLQLTDNAVNLYLNGSATVKIGTGKDAPDDDMQVGVTLKNGTGAVTPAENSDNYSQHFTSDNKEYSVSNKGTGSSQQVVIGNYFAKIVETGACYETVQAAVNDTTANQTVQLLKNANECITVAKDDNLTLDLNGFTLTAPTSSKDVTVITNNGALALTDSSTDSEKESIVVNGSDNTVCGVDNSAGGNLIVKGNVTIKATASDGGAYGIKNEKNSTIVIESVTVYAEAKYAYGLYNDGTIKELSDGTFNVTSTSSLGKAYGLNNSSNATAVKLSGATFKVLSDGEAYGLYNNGTVTELSGGTFTVNAKGNAYGLSNNKTVTKLSGGSFNVTSTNAVAYDLYNFNGTVGELSGGTYIVKASKGKAYGIYNNKSITVSGGTFDVTTTDGVAYGLYNEKTAAVATVTEGSFTVISENSSAYGLSNLSGATEKLTGGKVTVKSLSAAYGICNNNSTFTVEGGTLEVTSTKNAAYGFYNNGGIVEQSGGTFTVGSPTTCCGLYNCGGTVSKLTRGTYTVQYAASEVKASPVRTASKTTVSFGIQNTGLIEELSGGTFNVTSSKGAAYGLYSTGTVTKLSGGDFTVSSTGNAAYGLFNDNSTANATVTGGTFTVTGGSKAYGLDNKGTATVTGGTFNAQVTADSGIAYALWNEQNGTMPELSGDTLQANARGKSGAAKQQAYGLHNQGTVTKLTGGTYTAGDAQTVCALGNAVSGTIDKLTGGTFTASNGSWAAAMSNPGKAVVTGGTFNATGASGSSAYGIYQNPEGSLTLGGSLKATGTTADLYLPSGVTVTVAAGEDAPADTVKLKVLTQDKPTEDSCVDITGENATDYSKHFVSADPDYAVFNDEDDNNTVKLGLPVASVTTSDGETTNYHTLKEAIDATESGDTVKLLEDIALEGGQVQVTDEQDLTLDLNGKKLAITDTNCGIVNNGTLTLTDSVGTGSLAVSNSDSGAIAILNNGTLTVEDAKITATTSDSTACCILNSADGDCRVKSGTIAAEGGKAVGINNNGTATLTGGTIQATGTNNEYGIIQSGTMTVGGSLQVTDSDYNLYLLVDKTVTVGTGDDAPTTMKVGVTTADEPDKTKAVPVTGTNASDCKSYFTPDDDTYTLVSRNGNTVEMVLNEDNVLICTDVDDIDSPLYDGTEQTPDITVWDGDRLLTEGVDYVLSFSNNVNAGTRSAKVTITGINGYWGTRTVFFSIRHRHITLTSADATKVYDGTALTCHEMLVSGDGFVDGEGLTYEFTGTITEIGTAENSFTYTLNKGTKAGNYEVEVNFGTLTVTDANSSAGSGNGSGSNGNGSNNGDHSPNTGDKSNTALWATLAGVSLAGTAAVVIGKRKKSGEEK